MSFYSEATHALTNQQPLRLLFLYRQFCSCLFCAAIGKVAHRAWNVPDKQDQQPFNSIDRHRLRLKWKPIVVQESFHDRIGSRKNAV